MTVTTTSRTAGPFLGTGTVNVYAFAFKIFLTTDVLVQITSAAGVLSTGVLGTDYSVSMNADQNVNPGGNVILTNNLASGASLSLGSQVPQTQTVVLTTPGNFYPQVVSDALDKLTILIQQALGSIVGAIRVPEIGATPVLPAAALRANNLLSFDSLGNPIAVAAAAQSATALSLSLLSNTGSTQVTQGPDTAGTQPMSLFNIIKERTNFSRFLTPAQQTDFLARTLTLDLSTPLATALAERAGKKLVINGKARVSQSFSVGNNGTNYGSTTLEGESKLYDGIVQYGTNLPILKVYTGGNRVANLSLSYATLPANTDTDSVGVRTYNVFESQFENLNFSNVFGAFDQFQGATPDGNFNTFFSNEVNNIWITVFSGWAARWIPFNGGNSGNKWGNFYLNNRNGASPTNDLACLGGIWLQTSQGGTIDQLNIEWCRNAGSLLVLNQAGNISIRGLHFEGNYPQTAFAPLVDIQGGDGSSPSFESIVLAGNSWAATANQALFRLDANGTRLRYGAIECYNNTSPGNMALAFNGGTSAYGSTIEGVYCSDPDGALQNDPYSPKVSFGTANFTAFSTTLVAGGAGYTVGDNLTVAGGAFSAALVVRVSAVSAGVVTAVTIASGGSYSTVPSGTLATTGGTGTGATVSATFVGLEFPLQRHNLNIAKHSALVTDNTGGTLTAVASMTGSVTSPAFDGMGLWYQASNQFVVKQSGNYQVQALIPTAASPVVQVKQNGTVVAGLTPPSAGGHDCVTIPCVRGDIIKLTLASGSFTRTGVTFGISLAS